MMNDASRGGLRGSWPARCRVAGTWVPLCATWMPTGLSLKRWEWPTRWRGFSWRAVIRIMRVGGWCVRWSSIRPLMRPGRGARGARWRWCRRIWFGLPVTVAGRRWRVRNTSRLSAVRSRSPFMLTKPLSWRIWAWSAPRELLNGGVLRWPARWVPAHVSRSRARSTARFAHDRSGWTPHLRRPQPIEASRREENNSQAFVGASPIFSP